MVFDLQGEETVWPNQRQLQWVEGCFHFFSNNIFLSRPLGKFLKGNESKIEEVENGSFTPRSSQWFRVNGFLFKTHGCFGADFCRVLNSIS